MIVGLGVALSAPAWAQSAQTPAAGDIAERVDTHLERGIEFYAEKQYELAIVEFRAGYALDPRPEFLFALAQAERLSGDCPTAVVYYERFLATDPDANQAEAARVNMRRCRRALESGPGGRPAEPADEKLADAESAGRPEAPPVPDPVASSSGTVRERQQPRPWYGDKIGASLAAGGVVTLGLGVGFWVAQSSAANSADDAASETAYQDAIARARRNRNIALVSFGVTAGLAAAASYRFLTSDSRRPERRTSLSFGPTPGGGGAVTLSGRF